MCKDSLWLPQRDAMKRLMKQDMTSAIFYFFFLLFILTVQMEIELLTGNTGEIPQSIFYIQVIIIYPIFMILLGLTATTIIAGCCVIVSRMLKRKLMFQLLWKQTIFALTKPIILLALANFLIGSNLYINSVVFILLAFTMYKIITNFPKRNARG